jgi:hypothetical protein
MQCPSSQTTSIHNVCHFCRETLPKFSHVTLLLRTLHWLSVEAHIYYKSMVAYRKARGTAPPYLPAMFKAYTLK